MDKLLHDHLGDRSLPRRLWEKRMERPEDIALKNRGKHLQGNHCGHFGPATEGGGVVITHDVLAAIQP
jgi:hypothetical protein